MSKNRVVGGFEDMFEKGQQTVVSAVKQTVTDFAGSAKGQIIGNQTSSARPSVPSDVGVNESANSSQNQQMSDDAAKQFLKDLYGKKDQDSNGQPSQSSPQKSSSSIAQSLGIPQSDPNVGKTPEEIVKLQMLRNQLHQDYYQNLVNRPKSKEEPVTEKLEREKQMEDLAEQKKQEKKPGPMAVQMAQQSAEKFRGASG